MQCFIVTLYVRKLDSGMLRAMSSSLVMAADPETVVSKVAHAIQPMQKAYEEDPPAT